MSIRISRLDKMHDRKAFSCGEAALDSYLKTMASQDAKRGYASVLIASPAEDPKVVMGFYTLSSASVSLDRLSEEVAGKLPRYPDIPAVLLGRLAVDKKCQGLGLGRILVLDAIRRSCACELAWAIFMVEAKDDKAKNFYLKLFFRPFEDNFLHMWMKRKQAERLVKLI